MKQKKDACGASDPLCASVSLWFNYGAGKRCRRKTRAWRSALAGTASLFLGGCLLLLVGCEVGPDYEKPKIGMPTAFGEQAQATSVAAPELGRWWRNFNDAELNALVDRALAGNFDLAQAESRIREARAQLTVAGAVLWPQLNATGNVNHLRSSQALVQAFGAQSGGGGAAFGSTSIASPGPPTNLDLYQIGFDVSWEIDLWGGGRRAVEAAAADAQAAIEDRRDVEVSLTAELARTYMSLRGVQQRIVIAERNLAAQREELELTRARSRAGLAPSLDVEELLAQVAATEASIPTLVAASRQAIHALAVLVGEMPESLSRELTATAAIPSPPPEVPVGMPSELLKHRADIRKAERNLAAASARIGNAEANLFPSLDLNVNYGFQSLQAKSLFNWSNHFYSIFPTLTQPIFEAGRIRATITVAEERELQAAEAYHGRVLTAVQEVEDALSAYRADMDRSAALSRAVEADRRALDLARQQYRQGLVTVLTVLDTERSLLSAEDAQAQTGQAIASDLVALYKALGGDWTLNPPHEPLHH